MLTMILKMTAVTSLYVLLTALIWKRVQGRKLSLSAKLVIGVIYGLCAVLSTHFAPTGAWAAIPASRAACPPAWRASWPPR